MCFVLLVPSTEKTPLLVFKVDEVSSIWLASEVLPNRLEQAMSKHSDSTPQKKHRGLIVVIIVAVILIAIAAAGNGASNGSSNSSGDSASQSQDSANNPAASDSSASDSSAKIDADKFAKIESGMTYDQVKEIIGSDGTEQSTSAVGNTTTTIYEWDSDSFGVATVTFQDDKVVNKAQAGVGNKSTGTATMDKYNQVQTGMSDMAAQI